MDLVEIIELRKTKLQELTQVIEVGKTEQRKLTTEEELNVENLKKEIQGLDSQIEEINNRNNNKTNNKKMENFKDLIVRKSDGTIENMKVETRALGLSTSIDNVTVDGSISTVGYQPIWKSLGVNYMPNLSASIKLPYVGNIKGKKVAEGGTNANDKAVATITLQPVRFPVTEVVGKELLSVGNEAALQSFIAEMVKGCDKAITEEVYNVLSGATAVTGLTAYTTTNLDTLVGAVDGDVTVLMPRSKFYEAKGVKADSGSGKFLAEKVSNVAGALWDGTPVFYSALFDGDYIVAADMQHVVVAEFGNEVEIEYLNIPSKGQVEITVTKMADVALRNAAAARKAVIA